MRQQLQGADFPVLGGRTWPQSPASPELPTRAPASAAAEARAPLSTRCGPHSPARSRASSSSPSGGREVYGPGDPLSDRSSANENSELHSRLRPQAPQGPRRCALTVCTPAPKTGTTVKRCRGEEWQGAGTQPLDARGPPPPPGRGSPGTAATGRVPGAGR